MKRPLTKAAKPRTKPLTKRPIGRPKHPKSKKVQIPLSDFFTFVIRPFCVEVIVVVEPRSASKLMIKELLDLRKRNKTLRNYITPKHLEFITCGESTNPDSYEGRALFMDAEGNFNYPLFVILLREHPPAKVIVHESHHILMRLRHLGLVDEMSNATDEICAYLLEDIFHQIDSGTKALGALSTNPPKAKKATATKRPTKG